MARLHGELRLGSFNIRSLFAPGRLNLFKEDMEKHRIDVMAVQETWWTGSGEFRSEDLQVLLSGQEETTPGRQGMAGCLY